MDNTFYKKLYGKNKPEVLKDIIWEHLSQNPCSSCGESNPLVLQFDHLDPSKKNFSIANVLSRPYDYTPLRIQKEIVQHCRILCANCHQIRTMVQKKSWRLYYDNKLTKDHT